MNYRALMLNELTELLRERKLGNVYPYNELNKIYGVTYLPPQQEVARLEAIKMLEKDDKLRKERKKIWGMSKSELFSVAASIATILTFVMWLLWLH